MAEFLKKQLIPCLFFVSLFVLVPFSKVEAAGTEKITLFKSEVVQEKDTTINIREEIHYYFPTSRHGIYWRLPVNYKVDFSFQRPTKFTLNNLYYYDENNVQRKYDSYERSLENGYVTLKIGDANTYISGEYVFVIDYSLKYATNYFDDHDELYLNLIGIGWEVPIDEAYATVIVPGEISDYICYTGASGSTEQNCEITKVDAGELNITVTEPLDEYEGYTIAVSMPKGTLDDTRAKQMWMMLLYNIGILLPIPVIIFGVIAIRKKGKNKTQTVIPHYDAPKDINPEFAGYVYKDRLDNKYITAEIINLAVEGYIKIKQVKKRSYELVRTEKSSTKLTDDQKKLLEGLFKNGDTVNTKKIDEKFYNTVNSIRSTLKSKMSSDGMYDKPRLKLKNTFIMLGVFATVGAFIFFVFAVENAAMGTFLGILFSGIALLILSSRIDKRSEKGNKLYHEILGLRMYIDTAEKHRIEFHNDPDKFLGVFEKLLPFAIIFGLEKKWAGEFEDLYKEPPTWYEGNMNTFNTYMLANSISSMNRNVQSKASPPSSHGASGGSGFSGGSSGGGFGGSGGGSW